MARPVRCVLGACSDFVARFGLLGLLTPCAVARGRLLERPDTERLLPTAGAAAGRTFRGDRFGVRELA